MIELLLETADADRAPNVDTTFYHRAYTQGLKAQKVQRVLDTGVLEFQLQQALKGDVSLGRRRRLFDCLLQILRTRWGARLARLIPVRLQRRVKRLLLRGPMHE